MVGLCEAKKKAEMRDPIWEVGEKGVLLVEKKHKMHKNQQKNDQKSAFWGCFFPIEIRTLSRIISLKCTESKSI
jgi:hypothetical protein